MEENKLTQPDIIEPSDDDSLKSSPKAMVKRDKKPTYALRKFNFSEKKRKRKEANLVEDEEIDTGLDCKNE